jgi:hypothetical protein
MHCLLDDKGFLLRKTFFDFLQAVDIRFRGLRSTVTKPYILNMFIGARCADNNAEDRTSVGEADVDDLRNLLVVVVDDLVQRADVEGKLVAVESEEVGGVIAAHVPVGVRDDGEGERHCLCRVRVVGVDVGEQTRVGVLGRWRILMVVVVRKRKYTGGCPHGLEVFASPRVWSLLSSARLPSQRQGLTFLLFASLVNQTSPPNCSYDAFAEWLSQEAL